jgi:hypothetical protein
MTIDTNNHTVRPVLAGIFLLVLVGGGVCLNTIYHHKKQSSVQPINSSSVSVADPYCTGSDHPKADFGYGIENTYTDFITPAMPVTIVLSCNQDKLTITGSINQIITSEDIIHGEGLDIANGMDTLRYSPDDFNLVDTSNGSEVIDTATDFNFDEYNDLSVIVSNGMDDEGYDGLDEYAIYLYNPSVHQFIYNSDLSSIANISVNESQKTVVSAHNCKLKTGKDGNDYATHCNYDVYKWVGEKLIEVAK